MKFLEERPMRAKTRHGRKEVYLIDPLCTPFATRTDYHIVFMHELATRRIHVFCAENAANSYLGLWPGATPF